MAKQKKKRNKQYRPKDMDGHAGINMITRRLVDQYPLSDEQQANVVTDYHAALVMFGTGQATKANFDTLVYACNVGRILAENDLGDEYVGIIDAAVEAMSACSDRYDAEPAAGFHFTDEEMEAMKMFADLHEAQMEIATRAELEAAIKAMHIRLAAGLKVNKERQYA
jgi:hypothetical protein